jgi:hypothetical protein
LRLRVKQPDQTDDDRRASERYRALREPGAKERRSPQGKPKREKDRRRQQEGVLAGREQAVSDRSCPQLRAASLNDSASMITLIA